MELPKQFLDRMKNIVPNYDEFLKSYDKPSVKSFFINQNNISVETFLHHCNWDISQYANGYLLNEDLKVGKTPEHHAGMIYVQELSAMMPTSFLPLNPTDWVLDLCSAPGGKSIQVANRLTNGCLVSNEINRQRAGVLKENIERMGLSNVCVTNNSPDELEQCFQGVFDAVVVDAPCSGEGMFRKDEDAILNWSPQHTEACANRQLLILDSANKLLKQGGYLLYSTCTFSVQEDEMVVAEFCRKYNYDIIPLTYPSAQAGEKVGEFKTEGCLRFYPHKFTGEGQFVALLKKNEAQEQFVRSKTKLRRLVQSKTECNVFEKFCKEYVCDYVDILEHAIINNNIIYYVANFDLAESGVRLINCGVKLGEIIKNRFEPDHNFAKAFGKLFVNKLELGENVYKYLHGETFVGECEGYVVLTYLNVPIGFGKASGGIIKNHYPKGLRNL